ncbi:ABC transporter-like protein [Corchorus olitorius]|uniref:ABC transporter-like protein n=1 Tax=Corchorus olitorius TaxID=93759 RepID=A0A1R3GBA0_9ROSI|nr:ABC transporter-like protein [Corchorus olitorius]
MKEGQSFEVVVNEKDTIIVSAIEKASSFGQPRQGNGTGVSIKGQDETANHSDAISKRNSSSSTTTISLSFDEIEYSCCIETCSEILLSNSDDAADASSALDNHGKAEDDDISCSESQAAHESCTWRKLQFEPTLPISLKFEDIKYKVPGVKGEKRSKAENYILDGITGLVHPGELLALMAPSGGGKTTLLNLLSGRVKFDSGTITYNDQPYSKSLKRRIGFVLQDDVAFPHLTVKETLTYAALLRLPNTLPTQQKKERAMTVITELGLERRFIILMEGV